MLTEKIDSLKLPRLMEFKDGTPVASVKDWEKRRREILDLLMEEEYGLRPKDPVSVSVVVDRENANAYAGKAIEQRLTLSAQLEEGEFSFPFIFYRPKMVEKPMVIMYISFPPELPHQSLPIEEILDEDFALAVFIHDDVAADREDNYTKGLAGLLKKQDMRSDNDTGKIMMWAWAASRIMDYLQTREDIDRLNIGVMGHSRLGKTTLVAAAYDERFTFAFPNNAGCSGDAITRGKEGERIDHITGKFPYWFCPNYAKYTDKEEELPFDQHFLAAAVAPRFLCAGVAEEDHWSDPKAEYLTYVIVDEVYRFLGMEGFVHPDRFPVVGETFHDGAIGFHLRAGTHFQSRYDWQRYMEFMKKHRIIE